MAMTAVTSFNTTAAKRLYGGRRRRNTIVMTLSFGATAVGLGILVLAQMPGQRVLDGVENSAFSNAVSSIEYREIVGEVDSHSFSIATEAAQIDVSELHGDSSST